MSGQDDRLRELIRREAGQALIVVDASAGLSLGALPGLENFEQTVRPLLASADGVVCSPGQLRRLSMRTSGDAALLVRMDWTNTLREPGFVLPPAEARRVPILTPRDVLDLGAQAMVATFLLGYDEEVEADCIRSTVRWAMEGHAIGLPLAVEVQASGPRIALPDKAIELGASYALEGGADVVVIPYPGRKSLETIAAFVRQPWLVKASGPQAAAAELAEVMSLGGAGLWLDHRCLALPDSADRLESLRAHRPAAAAS